MLFHTPMSLSLWLGARAKQVLKHEAPLIVAVTGTVGKSSTKQAIAAMLNADEPGSRTHVSKKNYNNELGVPLTILGMDAPGRSLVAWIKLCWRAWFLSIGLQKTGIRTFVLEMGADRPGDLAYLTSIAKPTIAVITAVTPEETSLAPSHTANYPSIDALAEEKATLLKALSDGGVAVLNADDKRVFSMRHQTSAHVLTFGEADGTDVRIVQTKIRMEEVGGYAFPVGLEVTLECLNQQRSIFVPNVFGRPMAYAVAAATAVAIALDVHLDALLRLPGSLHALPGRTRLVPGIKNTMLLDDTYNASPAAVLSALRDLAAMEIHPGQRRIVCLGEMRELGSTAEQAHQRIGVEAARLRIDMLVVCGTLAHAIAEGARAAGMTDDHIKIFADTPEAGLFLQQEIRSGDLILAKASEGLHDSKGVRMERVIKELMAEPLRAKDLLVRQEEVWQTRR